MKAYIFPGQGAQFTGMGLDLFENSSKAKKLFEEANELLGFDITKIMFEGTPEELKETKVTQPAIFLHSTILAIVLDKSFQPDMVAGHSLGEISALVANKTLAFKDGLLLVSKRAQAMQKACELKPSTMAAVLNLEDAVVDVSECDMSFITGIVDFQLPKGVTIYGKFNSIAITTGKVIGYKK